MAFSLKYIICPKLANFLGKVPGIRTEQVYFPGEEAGGGCDSRSMCVSLVSYSCSYWLRMGVVALAALVVAVLSHYFWVSGEKDLVYSIGSSVPIIAAVMLLLQQQCADYRRGDAPSAFCEYAESRLRQDAPVIRVDPDSWGPGAGSTGFSLVLAAVRDYSFKGTCHRNSVSVDCSSGNNGLLQTGEKGGKEKFLIIRKDSPW